MNPVLLINVIGNINACSGMYFISYRMINSLCEPLGFCDRCVNPQAARMPTGPRGQQMRRACPRVQTSGQVINPRCKISAMMSVISRCFKIWSSNQQSGAGITGGAGWGVRTSWGTVTLGYIHSRPRSPLNSWIHPPNDDTIMEICIFALHGDMSATSAQFGEIERDRSIGNLSPIDPSH